jgi:hypothetical protein
MIKLEKLKKKEKHELYPKMAKKPIALDRHWTASQLVPCP